MRSRDFLIPGYPGNRISRRHPYFRPQLPITSHLLSIYYIQHAKICDGLTTFINALLSDRKQKNKMPTVSSFFARVFLTTYYFLLRISSLPNLRTPAQKKNKKKEKKKKEERNRQQDSNYCFRMFTYHV